MPFSFDRFYRLKDIEQCRHKANKYKYVAKCVKELGVFVSPRKLSHEKYQVLKSMTECKKMGYAINENSIVAGFVKGMNGYYPVFDIRTLKKAKRTTRRNT